MQSTHPIHIRMAPFVIFPNRMTRLNFQIDANDLKNAFVLLNFLLHAIMIRLRGKYANSKNCHLTVLILL